MPTPSSVASPCFSSLWGWICCPSGSPQDPEDHVEPGIQGGETKGIWDLSLPHLCRPSLLHSQVWLPHCLSQTHLDGQFLPPIPSHGEPHCVWCQNHADPRTGAHRIFSQENISSCTSHQQQHVRIAIQLHTQIAARDGPEKLSLDTFGLQHVSDPL